MKSQSYMTRALRARDPRFASVLRKLGYAEPAPPSEQLDPLDHDGDGRKGGAKAPTARAKRAKDG